MRRLLIGLGLLSAVAAGTMVAATMVLRTVVARQRETILAGAAQAIGRGVTVETVDVEFWGTPSVRVGGVRVAEDPRFGSGMFVTATAASAHVRWWPLLTGRVVISRLRIEQPEIHLVRDADGVWNVSTLATRSVVPPPAPSAGVGLLGAALAASDPPPAPSEWPIGALDIDNGVVLVSDRAARPPRQVRLAPVGLRLRDLSWDRPVPIDLQAGVDADAVNLSVSGYVGPLQAPDGVAIDLEGDAGPFGPQASRLTAAHLLAKVTREHLTVRSLTGRVFDGTFELTADAQLLPPETTSVRGTAHTVALQPLLLMTVPDAGAHFDGLADVRVDLQAVGHSAADVQASLTGTLTTDVHDGTLTGMNIPSEVLRRVAGVQDPLSLLSDRARAKYRRLFSDTTTRFETMHASLRIGERRVETDDLRVVAPDYGVEARGWLGFDRRMDVTGRLRLSQGFSTDLAADVKVLRPVLDREGRVSVPFRMRGRLGEASPEPDLGNLLEQTLRGLDGGGGVGGFLDQLFGGKKGKKK